MTMISSQYHPHVNFEDIQVPEQPRLDRWKISAEEFQTIINYIKEIELPFPDGYTVIRRKSVDPELPYSLACISKDGKLSISILLKGHTIGVGTFNKVRRAYNIHQDCEMAYRSGRCDRLGENEVKMNQVLSKYPELFICAEDFFYYKGPCSAREIWEPWEHLLPVVVKAAANNEIFEKAGALLELGRCSLLGFLKVNITENRIKMYIALRVAEGLKILHEEKKVVLADLKCENIIMTKNGYPKITDFGRATVTGNSLERNSVNYIMAPESINEIMLHAKYTLNTPFDIWSFGLMLLHMVSNDAYSNWRGIINCISKQTNTLNEFNDKMLNFIKKLEETPQTDPDRDSLFSLIKKCLVIDPAGRATAAEVVDTLNDMLKDNNVESLREELAAILAQPHSAWI